MQSDNLASTKMKTKNMTILQLRKSISRSPLRLGFLLITLALAMDILTANAAAGDLFEADFNSGTIYKFAPDGTRSTFATGQNEPYGLACDSAGNLFEAGSNSGTIYKFATDGTRSTFATGLNGPAGLALDS